MTGSSRSAWLSSPNQGRLGYNDTSSPAAADIGRVLSIRDSLYISPCPCQHDPCRYAITATHRKKDYVEALSGEESLQQAAGVFLIAHFFPSKLLVYEHFSS
jgi:hypothetical protein